MAPLVRRNWLDRAVSLFSPRAGLKRLQYRRALAIAEKFSYEGAMRGRRTGGWVTANSDANRETQGSMVWLRDRARDLVRNNPYAAKALSELVGNQIGTGIIPRADTGDDKLNTLIDEKFNAWSAQCDADGQLDFFGVQWLVARCVAESGECIVRFRQRRPGDGLAVPVQVQILEPDYLDHNKTLSLDTGTIIQGVQFDPIGHRNFYWLFGNHPGALTLMNWQAGFISKPVPASEVLHIYKKDRPQQVRGVTWFAPVMLKMRDLDEYEDAELIRKKIEACFAAFIVSPDGALADLTTGGQTDPTTNDPVEYLEPGIIKRLKLGEDVRFGAPSNTGGYRDYRSTQLGSVAAGLTLPYELLTGDMSAVNYSSFRGGMLGFRNTIEAYRWLCLIPQLLIPIWRRFIDVAFLAGEIPEIHYGVRFTAPKFESVDPYKDAMAERVSLRTGGITWPEMVAGHGQDPEGQLNEIVAWNKKFDKAQVILDGDPRKTTDKGQERGDTAPAS
ncbi:MAG: phage portal protein [Terracidiphilus sp.]|nr:phage portal protein [Terracidiphilus sp.]